MPCLTSVLLNGIIVILESSVCWSKPTHEGEWCKEDEIQDSKTECRETLATKHQNKSSDHVQ